MQHHGRWSLKLRLKETDQLLGTQPPCEGLVSDKSDQGSHPVDVAGGHPIRMMDTKRLRTGLSRPMKAIRRITFLLFVSIALLSAFSAYGQPHPGSAASTQGSQPLLNHEPPAATEPMHGLTVPKRHVTMSAPLEGVLKQVYVEEGQTVKKGQDLAEMDVRVAAAAVKVARLRAEEDESVRYAHLALKHAELRLLRTSKSHKAEAATDFEVREATLLFDQAQVAVEAAARSKAIATAALELEIQRLEQHKIAAPFAGRIVRLFAQPGATLTASDPLLTIVSLDELEAHIHLPVDQFWKLREGHAYHLYAEEPVGRVLKARLKMMGSVVESASQTFRCVFTIDNLDEKLPAGVSIRFTNDGGGADVDRERRADWTPAENN